MTPGEADGRGQAADAGGGGAEPAPEPDPEPPGRLRIEIVEQSGDWGRLQSLTRAVDAVAGVLSGAPELEYPPAVVVLALSDDSTVAGLNTRWRNKSGPTNVLSFPASPSGRLPHGVIRPIGDVILAAETLAREADARAIPFTHHFQHLVMHGVLHLLGYDHETAPEAERMETLEGTLLARLGVADPHGPDREEPGPDIRRRDVS